MPDLPIRTAAAIAVIAFLATAIAGVAVVKSSPATGKEFIQIVQDEIVGKIDARDPPSLAVFIFFNNLQACVLLFLGGATLGALTLFIIASNGVIIGGIMELVREERGLLYVAAAILPHGIFEIPAFIISAALGFILGASLLAEWHGVGDSAETARAHARTFLLVVVPLVVIAAFIEAFITPQVIHLVS
ncbi:MAG TPA: stage II sporulation protein M [Methanomicrobiales archaeon]|jgi:stage II sporulation protein M|nr:stage II sporulation protein M [Methanomicrobiales archaeon]